MKIINIDQEIMSHLIINDSMHYFKIIKNQYSNYFNYSNDYNI